MILPDGKKFRLVQPDQIPLNLGIRAQKLTDIGPMSLRARLVANQTRLAEMAPVLDRISELKTSGDDEADLAELNRLVNEFMAAAERGEIDLVAMGVQIWISRIMAGEPEISFEDACSFPVWEATTELEPEEQAELDRAKAKVEQVPPTTAAASGNGRASGKPSPRRRATSTST